MRITNRMTNGLRVAVFGYGSVGRGVAMYFRNVFAVVSVLEPQPVLRLRAHLDGFEVPDREEALANADIVVTVTGAPGVVKATDIGRLRDDVILINAGHLPWEIEVDALIADPSVASIDEVVDGITTLHLADGRRIHMLTRGHMVNLAGPRPLGNSIESMDLGFTLQARCLEAVATGAVDATSCVVPVPPRSTHSWRPPSSTWRTRGATRSRDRASALAAGRRSRPARCGQGWADAPSLGSNVTGADPMAPVADGPRLGWGVEADPVQVRTAQAARTTIPIATRICRLRIVMSRPRRPGPPRRRAIHAPID